MDKKRYNEKLAAEARKRRMLMAAMVERGKTYDEVGARFGITKQKVYWHLKKLREWTEEKKIRRRNGADSARPVRR